MTHTGHFGLWINPNHQTMVITWDQQQVERDLEGTGERYPENGVPVCLRLSIPGTQVRN